MKKCLYSLALLITLMSAVFSFTNNIKGRVTNEDGDPIPEVKVEVAEHGLVTVTGKNGIFTLGELPLGKYQLIFTHPDYQPGILEVNVTEKPPELLQGYLSVKNPTLLNIKEEITVTAEADSVIDVSLPSHRNILPRKMLETIGADNIAETVENIPGVAMVGKGGYSMVPSIRGLAEHRILLLIDGARITSERRVGPSASFINLNDIDRIEVNRGPYSVFYGSGAIGGVIDIITRSPVPDRPYQADIRLGYNSARQETAGAVNIGAAKGKYSFMLSASGKNAEDYHSPEGPVKDSAYTDCNLFLKLNRSDRNSDLSLSYIEYLGKNIGKPNPTSEFKPRFYPKERNTLLSLNYSIKNKLQLDEISANIYTLIPTLETQKENFRSDYSLDKKVLARVNGTNFGFKLMAGKKLRQEHTLSFGLDFFGRAKVNDTNVTWNYDSAGIQTKETELSSLVDSARNNLGIFLDNKIRLGSLIWLNLGARLDLINTSNLADTGNRISRKDRAASAHLGSTLQITDELSLIANLGSSFRFPSLSELYYSGLTGRGTVFGNPDLKPETSINLDLGARYLHERFFASLYAFYNRINDMIQKYKGAGEEEYYYQNLSCGNIYGLEGDLYFWLNKNWDFHFHFHLMQGKDKVTKEALNYISPLRINLSSKWSPGILWIEPEITLSQGVPDPGPLEVIVNGYTLCDLTIGVNLSKQFRVILIGQNLLNTTYHATADELGVNAPGRSLVARFAYSY